ncbi:hypothetical protein [Lysinibacillus sp. fls2-241-R2A-57]|nr:hypothetical protein [Lysinibacillus sp. fls2-241-R2A-57]
MEISVTDETLERSEVAHRTPPNRNGNQPYVMVISQYGQKANLNTIYS